MLEELTISGLGVIENAAAEFDAGFTVLTGETGAGKTMVVTSLHLLSGARADGARVRAGADKAVVEGRFRVDEAPAEVAELLESTGALLDDDDTVIAARSVTAEGRSRAHLGGRSVPAGTLGGFTTSLLAIHGQNDQLRLVRPDHQRDALDRFGGKPVAKARTAYDAARARWVAAVDLLEERRANSRERAQEADRLRYALDEIDAVGPNPGEDEELSALVTRLGDLEAVRSVAATAHGAITGEAGPDDAGDPDAPAVLDLLGQVRSQLSSTSESTLQGLLPRVEEALSVVGDIGEELAGFLHGLPADASELEKVLARQAELKNLVRKYAPDIDGVIAWRDDARRRLAAIDDSSVSIESLEADARDAADDLRTAATALTAARTKAAATLGTKVTAELKGLAMSGATLAVTVTPDEAGENDTRALDVGGKRCHAGSSGVDRVEFTLAAHSAAPAMPIARSASGGELSRVMLALEVVLAGPGSGSTMVFDEVDAGVGGRAAVEIGRRLAALARNHQVIVVTHLPQVAAFADHHIVIGKTTGKAKVTSSVTTLDRDGRVAELARMLAGLGDSDTGRAHAEELLDTAEGEKAAS
ncbi:DNA repair protein RecN [Williamsia serinedens]|uniref:DNA repair protein RecN n=1 Tax=Williamsia serinedens TaxID=391736 RepID=A0ABT1GX25_9NOCA|nr:DNA repair protein RecN [Williamsia serinedens]MCP2159538.1 DNA repair protein RecN (Recombination protein N) [Williamsia serinedens]